MMKRPYFMENEEWYTKADIINNGWPDDDRGYHLTELAPPEAVESYNEFYGIDEEKTKSK